MQTRTYVRGQCLLDKSPVGHSDRSAVADHEINLREALLRLQRAGFTLNKDKITLGASEIKYWGHYLSSAGVRVIPEQIEAIKSFPCTTTLRAVSHFIGIPEF